MTENFSKKQQILFTQEDNTETIMRAMENRFVHIIGHPGDPRVKFDVPRVVAHAKETKTILEIKTEDEK